jgi:predicted nucleic acid-binding protein
VEKSLELILGSDLLEAPDWRTLAALAPELRHTFEVAQMFRTPTEMRVSVLNDIKRPTPDAKYWQATREQDVFLNELVMLSYEYRKLGLDIRRLRRRLEAESDELEREALELEIGQQHWRLIQMERVARHRVREIKAWSQIKSELEPHLKYGTEDVDSHQLEAMRLRWVAESRLVSEHTPPADAVNILGLAQTAMAEGVG